VACLVSLTDAHSTTLVAYTPRYRREKAFWERLRPWSPPTLCHARLLEVLNDFPNAVYGGHAKVNSLSFRGN
jgi:hypothetical protein